jgi:hypothetical protein
MTEGPVDAAEVLRSDRPWSDFRTVAAHPIEVALRCIAAEFVDAVVGRQAFNPFGDVLYALILLQVGSRCSISQSIWENTAYAHWGVNPKISRCLVNPTVGRGPLGPEWLVIRQCVGGPSSNSLIEFAAI